MLASSRHIYTPAHEPDMCTICGIERQAFRTELRVEIYQVLHNAVTGQDWV